MKVIKTPASPAMAAPITNTREMMRSVLMPMIEAIFRSCCTARHMRPNLVLLIIQVSNSMPAKEAIKINTLV
ncbi:hypothetical protein D3C76_1487700 [compost metagenome]